MAELHAKTDATITPAERAVLFRVLRFDRVEPQHAQIHRLIRLQPSRDQHQRWYALVNDLLQRLPRIMRPRGLYRIDEVVALEPQRLRLASGTVYHGSVGTFLQNAPLIATFLVTIGSALERLSRGWLRAGKVMPGTIGDAIASEAAEAVVERLTADVRAWAAARGLAITLPYSPGYCGMSIQQQRPLFASLPAGRINVRLTPSCLMLPVKSISGLIGIGPADKISLGGVPCETCDYPNCTQRRAPFDRDHSASPPA